MIPPFLFILSGMLSGILLSESGLRLPVSVLVFLTLAFFIFSYRAMKKPRGFALSLAIYFGALTAGLVNYRAKDAPRLTNSEEKVMTVRALEKARWTKGEKNKKHNAFLRVEHDGEKILLSIYSAQPFEIAKGDYLNAKIKLRPLAGAPASGCFDKRAHFARQNIYREGSVRGKTLLLSSGASAWEKSLERFREKLRAAISDEGYPVSSSLLIMMLLGGEEKVPYGVEKGMRKCGIAHIMAISGLHIGLLSGIWLLLLRALGISRLAFELPLLPFLWAYTIFLGDRPSVLRAVILMTFIVLGRFFNKAVLSLHFFLVSAFLYAVISPKMIFSYSSLLSYSATAALLIMLPLMDPKSGGERRGVGSFFKDYFWQSLKITFCVMIFTLPITLRMQHMLTPLGFIMNVLIIPLCALILSSGILRLLTFFVLPISVSNALYHPALWLWEKLVPALEYLGDSFWLTVNSPHPGNLATLVYYLTLAFFFLSEKRKERIFRDIFLSLLFILSVMAFRPNTYDEALLVTALDVGQGDCFIQRQEGGQLTVIDCGRSFGSTSKGETVLIPYLRQLGVHTIDTLVLSHYDDDHIGGAKDVLRGMRVKRIIAPPLLPHETNGWEVMRLASQKEVEWLTAARGDRFGDTEVLWPPPDDLPETSNGRSLVLLTRFRGRSLMWTGDLPKNCEYALLEALPESFGRLDVYKVPHHGSASAGSYRLLKALSPKISLISVGPNPYGHPHRSLLARYRELSLPLLRTDELGTLTVRLKIDSGGQKR